MSEAERAMVENRRLRDAALAIVRADIAHVRQDLTARGLGGRLADKIGEEAHEILDEAVDVAESNKGIVVTIIAALALWLARGQILALLGSGDEDGEEEEGDAEAPEPEDG